MLCLKRFDDGATNTPNCPVGNTPTGAEPGAGKVAIPEIKQRSRLSVIEFDLLLALLEHRIQVVPMEEFIVRLPEAERLLGEHKKDAPYIALTLHLGCPFWSYEKRFKQLENVEVLTTKDMIKRLRS